MKTTNPHMPQWIRDERATAALAAVRATFGQWVNADSVALLAASDLTRLTPILVRCGGCRFVAPADQVQHLIDIITREGSDYVRDASLPASGGR